MSYGKKNYKPQSSNLTNRKRPDPSTPAYWAPRQSTFKVFPPLNSTTWAVGSPGGNLPCFFGGFKVQPTCLLDKNTEILLIHASIPRFCWLNSSKFPFLSRCQSFSFWFSPNFDASLIVFASVHSVHVQTSKWVCLKMEYTLQNGYLNGNNSENMIDPCDLTYLQSNS